MIGHIAFQPQAAEPAIGKIEMNLLAQATLGADAVAVADDQHPDHQFGIDRGAAGVEAHAPAAAPHPVVRLDERGEVVSVTDPNAVVSGDQPVVCKSGVL